MRFFNICFVFLLFLMGNLAAQPKPELVQYTTEEGLSNNNVRCALQDSKGFVWLGTNDGLNRFDAYSFQVFTYDPTITNGLSDNGILALLEDRAGNIWIGTNNGGLNRYNPKNNQFDSWQKTSDDAKSSISDNTIYCLDEDASGNIWIGTKSGGVNKFNPASGEFTTWQTDEKDDQSLPSNYIWAMSVDDANQLVWLGTSAGLVKLSLSGEVLGHYPNKDGGIASILVNEDQSLWVGTWSKGLQLFDPVKNAYIEAYPAEKGVRGKLQQSSATGIEKADGQNLWVTTYGGGLHYFNAQTKVFTSFKTSRDGNTLGPNSQWKMIKDDAGNLWLATLQGAIQVLTESNKGFALFDKSSTQGQLKNPTTWSLIGNNLDDIWIGTLGGLHHVKISDDLQSFNSTVYENPMISNNRIKAISQDRSGNVWIGMWGGGINKLSRNEDGSFEVVNFNERKDRETKLTSSMVLSIYADAKKRVWIGTLGGLVCYDIASDKFQEFKPNSKDSKSISDTYIYTILESRDGTVWFGTARGLNRFNEGDQSFTSFKANPKQLNSLSHNKINVIFEDSKGVLWLGTNGGGLNRMNRKDGSFKAFTEKDGLKGNSVKAIVEALDGTLWITTNKGLNQLVNLERKIVKHYDQSDGLQDSDFSTGAAARLPSGHLIVGGPKGFNVFMPNKLRENEFAPPVCLTSFKLFGKEVSIDYSGKGISPLKQTIETSTVLNLTYEHRVVEFEFTTLNYVKAHKNKFAYMLEGFDQDWRYTSADRRFATYTNLPYKDGYVFRVKASNNDGKWNEDGVKLTINVSPPYWKTWWFQTALVLFVIFAAVSFYKYRVNQIQRQKEKLELLVEKRTEEVNVKNSELEQRNVELHQQQEEILSQRDYIEQKNSELVLQKTNLEKSYKNVQVLSEIGQQVASKLDLGDVVMSVYQNVNELMDASGFGIGIYNQEQKNIMFKGYIEKGEVLPTHKNTFDPKNDLASWCIHSKREIIINDIEAEYQRYINEMSMEAQEGEVPQSLIYMPLIHLNRQIGVITVQSFNKNAYAENEISLLRNLANYISIAVQNAEAYYEVKKAHDIIKSKNKDIMDSLRYAETIQKSVLPISSNIDNSLNGHFVLYKPKDVVSGDFYWFTEIENRIFAAVVDCTGHGVPGAFMSMIGHELLDVIIAREHVYDPAKILELLHAGVRSILQQDEQMNNDGMDVCLVMIESKRDSADVQVTFAGAKRPLFHYCEGLGFHEVKGDRKSVGGWQKEKLVTFTNVQLDLKKGACLYLTSDGFVDQHSLTNKKYGTKKLRKILENISPLDLKVQEEHLTNELNTHQSTQLQRDDITVFALKV